MGRDVSGGVICDHWDQSQVSTLQTNALSVSSSTRSPDIGIIISILQFSSPVGMKIIRSEWSYVK